MIKLKDILFESNVDDILDIIKNKMITGKDGYKSIETPDFILKIDEVDTHVTLSWIYMKTQKYKGTDVLNAIIKYSKSKGYKSITGFGIRGTDIVKIDGKSKTIETNGYYTLMRWGFIPDNGIKMINRVLKTKYPSLIAAYKDPEFWTKWKQNGKDYTGEFDIAPNSLSWKILLHKENELTENRIISENVTKKLVIMVGLPGSGKSTYIRNLSAPYICSADSYFEKNGKYEFDPSKLYLAHQQSQNNCRNYMRANKSLIVVDNTNLNDKERLPYEQLAEKFGYQIEYVVFQPEKRSIEDLANRNLHGVDAAKLKIMVNKYRPPSGEKGKVIWK